MRRRVFWLAAPAVLAAVSVAPVAWWFTRAGGCPPGCVLALGDSITFGVGLQPEDSYPSQLAKLIAAPVWNAGVSGDKVAAGLQRVGPLLAQHKPRAVVILLGINDAGVYTSPTPPSAFTASLQAIVGDIRIAEAVPFLCSLLPIVGSALAITPQRADSWLTYDGAIRGLAESMRVPLVDLSRATEGQTDIWLDGLHPNGEGSALIATAVAEALIAEGLTEAVGVR